jgi:hypothetical protein
MTKEELTKKIDSIYEEVNRLNAKPNLTSGQIRHICSLKDQARKLREKRNITNS